MNLNKLYGAVGKKLQSIPRVENHAIAAARLAQKNFKQTSEYKNLFNAKTRKAAASAVYKAEKEATVFQTGKRFTRQAGVAAGIGAVSLGNSAMRPGPTQSRTSYRGPGQTGIGSGRYA